MGPGPFWIENRKLKNHKKLKYLMIIGFQKNWDREVGGWGELYPNDIWMFELFFNFATSLSNSKFHRCIVNTFCFHIAYHEMFLLLILRNKIHFKKPCSFFNRFLIF